MSQTNLRSEHDWLTIPIPLSEPAVEMVRLHVDPSVFSSTALVRFPPGWNRSAHCRYAVDEEIVMLSGALHISGSVIPSGSYAFIPTGVLRFETSTPTQSLALAWFSGPTGATEDGVDLPMVMVDLANAELGAVSPFGSPGRLLRTSPNGTCWLVDRIAVGTVSPVNTSAETCDLATGTWAWACPGEGLAPADGRCVVRFFPACEPQ